MTLMKYLLDLILVLILVICALVGKHRGFVRSFLGLMSGVAAAIGAIWLGNLLAQTVYDRFIYDSLVQRIAGAISMETMGEGLTSVLDSLPPILRGLISGQDALIANLEGSWAQTQMDLAVKIAGVIEPVITGLLRVLFSILVFIVLSLVLRLMVRLLDGVCHAPVLGGINSLLGFLFGLLTGCLLVYLLSIWAGSIVTWLPASSFWKEAIAQSWIVSLFLKHNPLLV